MTAAEQGAVEAPEIAAEPKRLCILGPTASGKSAVAMAVAAAMPTVELVSIDSMQVYRGMDIGTAKPTRAEQRAVRHHLVDIADPAEEFTVSLFQQAWHEVEKDIRRRGQVAVLVGGTGLYLRSVIDGLEIPGRFPEVRTRLESEVRDVSVLFAQLSTADPLAASRIDPANDRRIIRALEVTLGSGRPFSSYGPGLEAYPPIPFRLLGLRMQRERLDDRIDVRYAQQMESGFLGEVVHLSARPTGLGRTARQALGYRELLSHVEDAVPLEDALAVARTRTRRFARRQLKWFQRDPRIEWVDVDDGGDVDHARAIERAVELVDATAS